MSDNFDELIAGANELIDRALELQDAGRIAEADLLLERAERLTDDAELLA